MGDGAVGGRAAKFSMKSEIAEERERQRAPRVMWVWRVSEKREARSEKREGPRWVGHGAGESESDKRQAIRVEVASV